VLSVLKSGSLNLLEPSGHVQTCNGIALPLIVSTAYGINLDGRMLDNILYVVGESDMPLYLLQSIDSESNIKLRCFLNSVC